MAKTKLTEDQPATPQVERFVCTGRGEVAGRIYGAGEYLELPLGSQAPQGFLPETWGPFFFCTQECSRHGRTFKPGELWDWPASKEMPEGALFAPLEQRADYEFVQVSNDPRGLLQKKASS